MTASEFAVRTGVSRETLARLECYAAVLRQWQRAINLVGAATLDDVWRRHMLDSAQLFPLLDDPAVTLVDLGSGAGFPGLVLAILGVEDVHLVESDQRKATFLREAARLTGTAVTIHARRIETLVPFPAAVVTSRACAPVARLCAFAAPFLGEHGYALLLKGQSADEELTEAEKEWKMQVERLASQTDPRGVILRLRGLSRHEIR